MTRKELQTAIKLREKIAGEMRRQVAEAILRNEKRRNVRRMSWELEYYESDTEILKDLLEFNPRKAIGFLPPDTSEWYDEPPVEVGDNPDENDGEGESDE